MKTALQRSRARTAVEQAASSTAKRARREREQAERHPVEERSFAAAADAYGRSRDAYFDRLVRMARFEPDRLRRLADSGDNAAQLVAFTELGWRRS